MKPVAFDYECPDSLDEAVSVLARGGDDAKILAGGQSLMPMMNFRVVRPSLLVDIGRLLELDFVREAPDGGLQIGALTRHRITETSPLIASRFPIVSEAMRHVAHLAIRNRGTIGGSLSHADPAAELPMLAVLLDAKLVTRSPRGERAIAARDFFVGSLTNAMAVDEILFRIDLPPWPSNTGWAFEERARRAGDFALAAAGAVLTVRDGVVRDVRLAMMGVDDTPVRIDSIAPILEGHALDDARLEAAVDAACAPLRPNLDLHASPEFRVHLARGLTRRVLRTAWDRACGSAS